MGDKLVSLAGAVSQGSTCRASTAAHNVTAWGWRELGMVEHSEEEQGELQAVCRAGEGSEGEGQGCTEVWPVLGSCGDWSRELGSFCDPKAFQAAVFCILCNCSLRNTRSCHAALKAEKMQRGRN